MTRTPSPSPAELPNDGHTIFAALRDTLADLYADETSARVVVADAGLDAKYIAFSARAQSNWHNILTEAVHQQRIDAILHAAISDYLNEPRLLSVLQQYRLFINQGGYLETMSESVVGLRTSQTIKTSGGAYIEGNIRIEGGKFVGRDEVHNYYGQSYTRLHYRSDIGGVLDFYTKIFIGRQNEWKYITEFANQKRPGYLLIEALPGYGKTALIAHLVRQHELRQWNQLPIPNLLYFFIRQEGGRNTPVAFLQAVNSQLLDILKIEGGVHSDLQSLRTQFSYLWTQVVSITRADQPLLFLIDGLDEIAVSNTTIADELPALSETIAYAHILVTSRPNPKPLEWVAIDHPFKKAAIYKLQTLTVNEVELLLQKNDLIPAHATVLALRVHTITKGEPLFARFISQEVADQGEPILTSFEKSPPANVEDYFRQQFKQLDVQAEGELTWKILSLLAISLGGITVTEIGEILNQNNYRVRKAIRLISRFLLGDQKLELMHIQLQKVILEEIGKQEQTLYYQKLLEWCHVYQQQAWPLETPDYILNYYARHLANNHQWAALYQLVDKRWMKLKLIRNFSHRSFADDVTLAVSVAERSMDWVQLVRNCHIYASLRTLATNMPPGLLSAIAQLGSIDWVIGYIALIQDQLRQNELYCYVAQTLLKCGKIKESITLANLALEVAECLRDEHNKTSAFSNVAQVLAQAGDVDRAMELLKHIPNENPKIIVVLGKVAQALVQADLLDQAIELVEQLTNERDKALAFDIVAHLLMEAGATKQARVFVQYAVSIVERMSDEWEKAYVLDSVAETLARVGEVEQAMEVVEYISHEWYKASALSKVAQVLVQSGAIEQAIAVADQSLSVTECLPGNWNNSSTLCSVAQILAHANKVERALEIAERITDKQEKASALGTIAQALAQADALEWSLRVIDSIIERQDKATALSNIAQVLARSDALERSLEMVERIIDKQDKARAYSDVAQILIKYGSVVQARAVVNQALILTESIPYEWYKAIAFMNVAQALAKAGCVVQASIVANHVLVINEHLIDEKAKMVVFERLPRILAQADEIERALQITECITDEWKKTEILSDIAKVLIDKGKVEPALQMAEYITNEWLKASMLSRVAHTLAKANFMTQANAMVCQVLEMAKRIPYVWNKVSLLSNVAQALVAMGAVDEARKVASQALDVTESITGGWYKATALSNVAQALIAMGAVDEARKVASQALDVAMYTDVLDLSSALSSAAQALVEVGEIDQALRITHDFIDEDHRLTILGNVSQALVKAGAIEQALQITKRMTNQWRKAYILSDITQDLAALGQYEAMRQLFRQNLLLGHFSGRHALFADLIYGAWVLVNIDNGKTLWQVYEAIQEIDNWWS